MNYTFLLLCILLCTNLYSQHKLKILATAKGNLYIDGVYKKEVERGDVTIFNIVDQNYIVQLKNKNGQHESVLIAIEEEDTKTIIVTLGNQFRFGPKINEYIDHRDGEVYKTMKIGQQTWMLENMRYYSIIFSYLNPNNPSPKYGKLYDWRFAIYACPSGWHLATKEDWKELKRYFENKDAEIAQKNNKAVPRKGFNDYNNWRDPEGFNALGAGYYVFSEKFYDLQKSSVFWINSIVDDDLKGEAFYIFYDTGEVGIGKVDKSHGASCRCVQD